MEFQSGTFSVRFLCLIQHTGRCFVYRYFVYYEGYWPSSFGKDSWILAKVFFACHGPRRSRSPQPRKKWTRPISSHLDWTSLVNEGFIIWLSGNFSCGIQRVVPCGQANWKLSCPLGKPNIVCDLVHLASAYVCSYVISIKSNWHVEKCKIETSPSIPNWDRLYNLSLRLCNMGYPIWTFLVRDG